MVLGDYARNEFLGVDAAVKRSQYAEGHIDAPKSVSVVVSSKTKTITVHEDDAIVARGRVDIEEEAKPLSKRAYTLTGVNAEKRDLRWAGVGYGKTDREDMTRELRRIKAEPGVREEVRKRMHHGMTLVTTDEDSTETHRTSRDFVVIDGLY